MNCKKCGREIGENQCQHDDLCYNCANGISIRCDDADPEGAAFLAERRIAELEAEVARLKVMHCPECGNDIFTRRDTGGQQCLECGTAVGPFISAVYERGAREFAEMLIQDEAADEFAETHYRKMCARFLASGTGNAEKKDGGE